MSNDHDPVPTFFTGMGVAIVVAAVMWGAWNLGRIGGESRVMTDCARDTRRRRRP